MPDAVDLLSELIRIPSENPPGNEQAVAEHLAKFLAGRGLPANVVPVEPGRPNVICELTGTAPGPRVWLNAHLDTVPAGELDTWKHHPFSADCEAGRIFGRGASDDKGGVAVMASTLAELAAAGGIARGQIVLTAVIGEETGNVGTGALLASGFSADLAIVGEYSGARCVANGYRGNLWLEVHVRGRAAHGSRPRDGANAIDRMIDQVLPVLRARNLPFEPTPGFLDPAPSLSVNRINGGTKVNVIADACRAELDFRLVPGQNPGDLLELLRQAVQPLSFPVSFRVLSQARPFVTPVDSKLVAVFRGAIRDVTGAEAQVFGKTGTSDANLIASSLGIPVIAYGPGNGSGHGPDEFTDANDVREASSVLRRALKMLCGKGAPET